MFLFFSGLGNRSPKKILRCAHHPQIVLPKNPVPPETPPPSFFGPRPADTEAAIVFPLVVSKPSFWQAAGALARRARRDVGVWSSQPENHRRQPPCYKKAILGKNNIREGDYVAH